MAPHSIQPPRLASSRPRVAILHISRSVHAQIHASIITLRRPETMCGAEVFGGSIVGHFGRTKWIPLHKPLGILVPGNAKGLCQCPHTSFPRATYHFLINWQDLSYLTRVYIPKNNSLVSAYPLEGEMKCSYIHRFIYDGGMVTVDDWRIWTRKKEKEGTREPGG